MNNKEKCFKLFELESGHQACYEKVFLREEDDFDTYSITATIHFSGVRMQQTFGYGTDEEKRDLMFEEITQERAQSLFNAIENMLNEPSI